MPAVEGGVIVPQGHARIVSTSPRERRIDHHHHQPAALDSLLSIISF